MSRYIRDIELENIKKKKKERKKNRKGRKKKRKRKKKEIGVRIRDPEFPIYILP